MAFYCKRPVNAYVNLLEREHYGIVNGLLFVLSNFVMVLKMAVMNLLRSATTSTSTGAVTKSPGMNALSMVSLVFHAQFLTLMSNLPVKDMPTNLVHFGSRYGL